MKDNKESDDESMKLSSNSHSQGDEGDSIELSERLPNDLTYRIETQISNIDREMQNQNEVSKMSNYQT